MHFEFLVEELSTEAALSNLVPNILEAEHTFAIHPFQGKPVIAGTRITVQLGPEKLSAGETVEQILDAHPRLTREGIQAAKAGRQHESVP